MGRAFAALAGVFAWAGWFSVAPALGLPSLGPAAMFNRVLAPRADSGFWLGWAFLSLALAVAILVYFGAVQRGLWRANIVTGLVYGAACWLVAGAVVMPLLGLGDPFPVPPPPGGPDAMHGTFMMLHLGIGAPLAALIAWLLLGVVLGASADRRPDYSRRIWALLFGAAAAIAILVAIGSTLPNVPPASSGASATRALSTGEVPELPDGPMFVSVFRLPQPPGSVFGPHAHVPGFAYSLRGVETMTFVDAQTVRVPPGEAGFMGPQQVHAHLNTEDRLLAGAVALLVVTAAGLVGWLGARGSVRDPRLMPAALTVLVVLGALATWNPWSNDWFFISIRPAMARAGPMPLPSASRVFESRDLAPLPAGPYTESVEELTIAPGPGTSIDSPGASLLLVIDGQAQVQGPGEAATVLGVHQATLLQPGSTAQIAAAGSRAVRLLQFSVMPAPITDPSSLVVPATPTSSARGTTQLPLRVAVGGGTVPPVWQLPSSATRIVSFPSVW